MKNTIKYLIIGILVILFSSPLGSISTDIYNIIKGNMSTEYISILEGFINSYRLIGFLISSIGLVGYIHKNK